MTFAAERQRELLCVTEVLHGTQEGTLHPLVLVERMQICLRAVRAKGMPQGRTGVGVTGHDRIGNLSGGSRRLVRMGKHSRTLGSAGLAAQRNADQVWPFAQCPPSVTHVFFTLLERWVGATAVETAPNRLRWEHLTTDSSRGCDERSRNRSTPTSILGSGNPLARHARLSAVPSLGAQCARSTTHGRIGQTSPVWRWRFQPVWARRTG